MYVTERGSEGLFGREERWRVGEFGGTAGGERGGDGQCQEGRAVEKGVSGVEV